MANELSISVGQFSDKGRKEINQDFHGVYIPEKLQLGIKGIAIAVADGISSSAVSQVASQSAVTSFLEDYYCTSEAWSVKTAVERVLTATNSWLHAQTQQSQYRFDKDRGYVCTLSAMVLKSTTAHVFHVGDSRIYQLRGAALEQLTNDHRVWITPEQSYLSRALGGNPQLEIDYRTVQIDLKDVFLFLTDGVYEYIDADFIVATIADNAADLDRAAKLLAEEALHRGSTDNLTVQLIRVDTLPSPEVNEVYRHLGDLPPAPLLNARQIFDGYRIIREIHGSSRSHIYLAVDEETDTVVSLKTPSIDLQSEPVYLERFMMEEWVARRLNSAHVLKPCPTTRKRNYLYVVTEYIEGRTLAQWMIDNPKPELETVRAIVEQIARGLLAFHRMEMLHQDLKPDNIMIDQTGTVKIIDFGSVSVAGVEESAGTGNVHILGSAQYTAPEYFLGEAGSSRSDTFALGVLTYQMLTGKLPYGMQVPKCSSKSAQAKLHYHSALHDDRELPTWVDDAIRKAVHINPQKRYEELSEFIFDLHHPNQAFLNKTRLPLIERDPVIFWKSLCCVLVVVIVLLLRAKSGLH